MAPPLPPDEVHVWTATREAPDDAVEGFRALLTDDERARADRFASPVDRRQFAVGRGLLRTILGRYLDRPPGSLRLVANAHGKPGLDPAGGVDTALRFNLAHSGTLALYAITRGREIGVDIEKIRPDFDARAIAARFFAPAEVDALLALPAESRTLAFFHGWTRKEAYIKARGKGLSLPLDEFEVAIDPARPAALLSTSRDPAEAARWSLVALPTEPGYVAAACVEGGGWAPPPGALAGRGRSPILRDREPAMKKFRPSISGLMTFVVSCALLLALARSRTLRPYMYPIWFGGLLLVLAWDRFWFLFFPRRLLDLASGGDRARRGRILRRIAAIPSPLGDRMKIFPRFLLFLHQLGGGELAEAEAQARLLLRNKLPAGTESEIRRRLADALETAGRGAEAALHRRLATARVEGGAGPSTSLARARLLEREGKYPEACDAYAEALATLDPSAMPETRVGILIGLALALFNAGRAEEAAGRALEAIAAGAGGRRLTSAHRIAALALSNLGRLDESEAHRRRSLELAEAAGDPAMVSNCLAELAAIERQRGKLAEAEASCRRAEALGDPGYELRGVWAETLRSQGRFEEAAGQLRLAFPAEPLKVPALDRRLRCALNLALAGVEADLGRWPEAEAHCREARGFLDGHDSKLGLGFGAMEARVAAGLGRRDEAAAAIDRVDARLAEFPDDRTTRIGALASIGRAALALGDPARAESLWSRYLEAGPDPVGRPIGHCLRGEALLGLGRPEDAREAFRLAVDSGIDSHHARLARARLDPGAADTSNP